MVARTLGVGEVVGSIPTAPKAFSVDKLKTGFKPEKVQMRLNELLVGHFLKSAVSRSNMTGALNLTPHITRFDFKDN